MPRGILIVIPGALIVAQVSNAPQAQKVVRPLLLKSLYSYRHESLGIRCIGAVKTLYSYRYKSFGMQLVQLKLYTAIDTSPWEYSVLVQLKLYTAIDTSPWECSVLVQLKLYTAIDTSPWEYSALVQ